jgi:aryl-alcohol dehydrogenase-like predicted oxidoreductase
MKRHAFGKTGLAVSPVGFGGAPIGYLGADEGDVTALLGKLLDAGVNVIDTAECYPGSEAAIGKAIGHRRSEYVLVTKCGHRADGLPGDEWSAGLIARSIDRSLKLLRTDAIDVALLHSCDLATLERGEALGALQKARDAGKIRWIGYSGDNEEAERAAELDAIAVLETSISICDQANIDRALARAAARGVAVLVKRPIANAAWRKLSEQRGIYVEYAKTYTERLEAMGLDLGELGFPGDPARAWPEVALRFTLSQLGVSSAIIGTTNPERIATNLAAAEKGPLSAAIVARIRAAFRRAEAASGEPWRGQT